MSAVATDLSIIDPTGLGNCFAGNTFTTSAPADIEALLPCEGEGIGGDYLATDLDVASWLADAPTAPPSVDYETAPTPEPPCSTACPTRPPHRRIRPSTCRRRSISRRSPCPTSRRADRTPRPCPRPTLAMSERPDRRSVRSSQRDRSADVVALVVAGVIIGACGGGSDGTSIGRRRSATPGTAGQGAAVHRAVHAEPRRVRRSDRVPRPAGREPPAHVLRQRRRRCHARLRRGQRGVDELLPTPRHGVVLGSGAARCRRRTGRTDRDDRLLPTRVRRRPGRRRAVSGRTDAGRRGLPCRASPSRPTSSPGRAGRRRHARSTRRCVRPTRRCG